MLAGELAEQAAEPLQDEGRRHQSGPAHPLPQLPRELAQLPAAALVTGLHRPAAADQVRTEGHERLAEALDPIPLRGRGGRRPAAPGAPAELGQAVEQGGGQAAQGLEVLRQGVLPVRGAGDPVRGVQQRVEGVRAHPQHLDAVRGPIRGGLRARGPRRLGRGRRSGPGIRVRHGRRFGVPGPVRAIRLRRSGLRRLAVLQRRPQGPHRRGGFGGLAVRLQLGHPVLDRVEDEVDRVAQGTLEPPPALAELLEQRLEVVAELLEGSEVAHPGPRLEAVGQPKRLVQQLQVELSCRPAVGREEPPDPLELFLVLDLEGGQDRVRYLHRGGA